MRPGGVAWVVLLLVVLIGVTHAAPPEEAITPVERYTTEKARALAATHNGRLTQIYDRIYRCHEWVEIPKWGLGLELLRHLSSHRPLVEDPALTGFSVILTWLKPGGAPLPNGAPGSARRWPFLWAR